MTTDPTMHFGQIRIEELPPAHVACLRAVSASPEEDAAEAMKRWLTTQCLEELARSPNFGFDVEVSLEEQQAGLRGYEVWYPIPKDVGASGAVTVRDFSGGLYAVMRLTNPFSDPFVIIPAGWRQLWSWGHANDRYLVGSHQCLERFIPDGDVAHLDLFLPVSEKTT